MNAQPTGEDPRFGEPEPDIELLPKQVGLGPVGKGVTTATTSAISAAFPPAAPAFAGLTAAMHAFGDKLQKQSEAQISAVISSEAESSNLSAEVVVEQLLERDDLMLLAAEAMDAARRGRLAGKAAALGHSLGSILADDALLDPESVWIRIIGTVERPHIRVLQMFLAPGAASDNGVQLFVKVSDVGEHLGLHEAVLPLVQDLIGCGLLMDPGSNGLSFGGPDAYGQSLKATPLAEQLIVRIRKAAVSASPK